MSLTPRMGRARFGAGWKIEPEAVDWLVRRLELRRPVVVTVTRCLPARVSGELAGVEDGAWRIYVAYAQSEVEASLTLAHECVHALQAEREGGIAALRRRHDRERRGARLDGPRRRVLFRGRAYDNLPLEQEAEELAWELDSERPLAIPRPHGRRAGRQRRARRPS